MSSFVADLRYAARSLNRSRGFFLLAVTTLAVGIGSTTALFTLVDAVLLRPLPFKEPHRLVEIWGRTGDRTGMRVPGVILEALRSRAKTLAVVGTHDPSGGVLNTAEGAIDIRGQTVSANFVDVFGVQPLVGRGFVPEDEQAGAPAVMLASFSFWQQYLGADAGAVGRTVYLDGVPYTVVGIMPREFRTQFADRRWVFWTPYAGSSSRVRERQLGYEVVARLAPGVSVDHARQEIEAIASSIEVEGWGTAGRRLGLVPLRDEVVGDRAHALRLLLAAVVSRACHCLRQHRAAAAGTIGCAATRIRDAQGAWRPFESCVPTGAVRKPVGVARGRRGGRGIRILARADVACSCTRGNSAAGRRCGRRSGARNGSGHEPADRLQFWRGASIAIVAPFPDRNIETSVGPRIETTRPAPFRAAGAAGCRGRHAPRARWPRPADVPDVVPVIRRFRDGIA